MTVSIIDPAELAARLARGDCRLVDARTRQEYEKGHVPGAVWVGWEDWCAVAPVGPGHILREPGYWGVLDQSGIQGFETRLADAGIDIQAPLTVYADGRRSKGREGRVAWMLLYFGAADVSLLNGGWTGWLDAGGESETAPSLRQVRTCRVELQAHRRVVLDELRRLLSGAEPPCLIDTRSRSEFAGDCYDYMPRKGRLAGSVLVPFSALFADDWRYLSQDSYLQMLPQRVRVADSALAYCEVGVRAATFAVLHEVYTGQVVPVYDGSLMEWGMEPDLEIV